LKVKDVREFGLDANQDKPDHVSITGCPHPELEYEQAAAIARKLALRSQLYCDWLECPRKSKKPKSS
jgi:hypothetical protein